MVERVDNSIRSAVELDEVADLPNYIEVLLKDHVNSRGSVDSVPDSLLAIVY